MGHAAKVRMSEKKKNNSSDKAPQATFRFFDSIADIKSELKKITWTTSEELKVYTKVVVATTFVFGMVIYLMDLTIPGALGGMSTIVRWLIG